MIWAGIVLFNPKLDRLKENIRKIINDVDGIILYNNGADQAVIDYVSSLADQNVFLRGNGENKGIAFALNEIMRMAKSKNAEWVITYDQDSITADDYVEQIKKRIDNDKSNRLAIVCPIAIDKRRIYPSNMVVPDIKEDYEVDMCITSGSCTSVKAWEAVGGFDDFLFIDLVDNDFCKRLCTSGWKIIKMGDVELDQEFGNITPRSDKVVAIFTKICKRMKNQKLAVNISKFAYKKYVSPMRVYYTNRNIIYLNQKLKDVGGIGYDSYSTNSYLGFMICFNLPSFLRAKEKGAVLKSIFTGIRDGIKARNVA